MDDTSRNPRRMQSEILAERIVQTLDAAVLIDQDEARDAGRYAQRLRFALDRVQQLRDSSAREGTTFEAARLDMALTILETHLFRAAGFIDGIARRQRSELVKVNRRIAGQPEDRTEFPAMTRAA